MARDTSRDDMSYAVRLANRDYELGQIIRALSAKPSGRREPGSLKYQRLLDTRGRDAADAYARRTAEKAVEFVRLNPRIKDRTAALVKLLEIEDAANSLPWAIYGGAGARRALEAAFVVARRVGGVTFGLALREWAEIAGQDFESIRSHRDLITRLGWLVRNADDRPGRTSRFCLRIPSHIHSQLRYECGSTGQVPQLNHDAFQASALGEDSWLLLHELSSRSKSLESLSIRTGFGMDATEDLLALLMHHDIIDAELNNSADLNKQLDRVAEHFKTAGTGQAIREQHRLEREAFRARRDVNVELAEEPA